VSDKAVWVTSVVLGLASGGELYRWIMHEDPAAPFRLHVFFLLLFLLSVAIGMGVAHYLAVRFDGQAAWKRSVRYGIEFGLFVAICAWLQLVRVLSALVAVLVAGVFVSSELFWTNRRRVGRRSGDADMQREEIVT